MIRKLPVLKTGMNFSGQVCRKARGNGLKRKGQDSYDWEALPPQDVLGVTSGSRSDLESFFYYVVVKPPYRVTVNLKKLV